MSKMRKSVRHSRRKTKAPDNKQADRQPDVQATTDAGRRGPLHPPAFSAAPQGPTSAGWHQIEDFLRCPKEYQFRKIRGLRKPTAQTPDYFAIGQLFHVAKAAWFESGFRTDEATMAAIRAQVAAVAVANKLPVSLQAEQRTLIYFEEYVAHYAPRPKPQVLAAEYDLGPAPLEKGDPFMLWRTARVDDVSRYDEAGGALCIGESKTTGGTIADCVQQYTLHGQTMLQALLWKNAPQGEAKHGPIAGIVLDIVQKGYGGKPSQFARKFIGIDERALAWLAKNLKAQLRAAAMIDWNADAPRNVTQCTRLVGRARVACEFRELCMYGKSAALSYVTADGGALVPWADKYQVPPWE